MKKVLLASLLGAALFLPAAANAATGYTSGRAVMRAGPGEEFPRVERLPGNFRVNIHGCTRRLDWCDVSFRGERGWIDGDQLRIPYQGRRIALFEAGPRVAMPVISFSLTTYWDSHYRGRPFYRDRNQWRERDQWRGNSNSGGFSDRDRDGVPNQFDRDRDGDGTPNRRDDSPNNPRRD